MSAQAPQICHSSVNQLQMLHFNRQIHTCYHNILFVVMRYVMEEVRRNLSWKRQPYLFWFGLIHAKRKQTMGILKMPPFCQVGLLTGDEHAHSFCRCVPTNNQPTNQPWLQSSSLLRMTDGEYDVVKAERLWGREWPTNILDPRAARLWLCHSHRQSCAKGKSSTVETDQPSENLTIQTICAITRSLHMRAFTS